MTEKNTCGCGGGCGCGGDHGHHEHTHHEQVAEQVMTEFALPYDQMKPYKELIDLKSDLLDIFYTEAAIALEAGGYDAKAFKVADWSAMEFLFADMIGFVNGEEDEEPSLVFEAEFDGVLHRIVAVAEADVEAEGFEVYTMMFKKVDEEWLCFDGVEWIAGVAGDIFGEL